MGLVDPKRMITIYHFSDTHGFHSRVKRVKADLYVHSGDALRHGSLEEFLEFSNFMQSAVDEHLVLKENILYVPGNHDDAVEVVYDECQKIFGASEILINRTVERFGLKFHGSPHTPEYGSYAFMDRDINLGHHWNKISHDVNVLISHGPVKGILDYVGGGQNVGSETLLQKIGALPDLRLFLCGHIHKGRGLIKKNGVTFINASCPETTRDSYDFLKKIHSGYLITYDALNNVVVNVEEIL